MTDEEKKKVESIVNEKIQAKLSVNQVIIPRAEAEKTGAKHFFGEKYGDEVRVVTIGDFSKELCGGTHLHSTGEIGTFKIVSEGSIQAGVRRIEAVTGRGAEQFLKQNEQGLETVAYEFKIRNTENILEEIKKIRIRVENLKNKALNLASNKWIESDKFKEIRGVRFWNSTLIGADKNLIQKGLSVLDSQHHPYAGIMYSNFLNQPNYYVVGSGDLVQKGLDCNSIIKNINQVANGKGGGAANFASGGLKELPTPEKIETIINTGTSNIMTFIEKK